MTVRALWSRFTERRRGTRIAIGLAGILGLALVALLVYSAVELARFDRVEVRRAALVYAMPQPLAVGVHVKLADLAGTLTRLSYTETRGEPDVPGHFRRNGTAWEIHLRGLTGLSTAQRVRIDPAIVSAPLITTLVDATGLMIYLLIAKALLHL